MTITEQIHKLKREWSIPRLEENETEMSSFRLKCSFGEPGVPPKQIDDINVQIPSELGEFWQNAIDAKLYEDVDYGQWGLQIFSPSDAESVTMTERKRSEEFRPGDLIVGQFIGDLDQLLVRCDASASDFGSVIIALAIYQRKDWYIATKNFTDFVNKYVDSNGDMFWEANSKKDVL